MNISQKRKLRATFFSQLGPNAETFKSILDLTTDLCMNMKDAEGRIMALNRKNCEVCNIADEWDAIGLNSTDLFPPVYAQTYMALDHEALTTKKPILNRKTCWPADRSRDLMISDLYPLRSATGKVIGTLHAYSLSSEFGANAHRYQQLKTAVDYITEHYAEDITLETLANLVAMSVTSFKRNFKAMFGESPGTYLLTTRLNAARKLLETTDKLLTDIAIETGFFDQSHFSRVFKIKRNMTPGEYRRRHRHQSAH